MRASLRRSAAWAPVAIAIATFALEWAIGGLRPTVFNNYVWLADAWAHHRLWIHFPGDWIDAVPYHGRAYVVEAPFPAVLLLPAVLVFGTRANETVLSAAVAAVATAAAFVLARRVGLSVVTAGALTAFFLVATDVLYCGVTGDVWLLAHVAAACCTMLCLVELFGKRRPWVVALWSIAAAFSRYPLLLTVPVYFAWLVARWADDDGGTGERGPLMGVVVGFCAVAIPAFALWCWYNVARWGTPFDVGYTIWYHVMDPRSNGRDAVVSLAHLPMQARLFLATPPHRLASFPWIAPGRFGTSLTFLCPALLFTLFAPWRRVQTPWLWLLLALSAVPSLLYYDIGGMQLGTRHALDFEPFAYALIALAVLARATWWMWLVVAYSTLAGAWMFTVWRALPQVVW